MPCEVPTDAHTFLYGARKALLLLHALASLALLGSSTHHALQLRALLRGGGRPALEALYARVVAVSYALVYGLGAALYPTYRYHVRALYLDRHQPWVSNLFDLKENLATIALPLALGLGLLGGRLTEDPADKPLLRTYAGVSLFVAAVTWFNVVSGLLVSSYRSV